VFIYDVWEFRIEGIRKVWQQIICTWPNTFLANSELIKQVFLLIRHDIFIEIDISKLKMAAQLEKLPNKPTIKLRNWNLLWSTNHATIWVCTNHASLRSIAFQHASMHVVIINSFYCFPTCVNACCRQRFSDTVFPQPREVAADFSSPHPIVASLVFRHVQHYNNIFCYYDF
jgi:hypothetical protein